jgi:hypothetical protein
MATIEVDTNDPVRISRRAILSVSMALPFLLSTESLFAQTDAATGAPIDAADLLALSIAIIGPKADDRRLSDAFHRAFTDADPAFLVRAAVLFREIRTANISAPDAFSASALAKDMTFRATATALTAAWYLGHVAHDDHGGKVVAYEKALMWAPTSDITVIPSYSRGAPDYWAEQTQQIEGGSQGL